MGGSQQARGRDYGHFKQSRVAGSAKQGTSAQGQCMASRWGRQGCRAATEGLEDAGPWAKEGRRKAAWTGRGLPAFLPSCRPVPHPPGVLGVRIPELSPHKALPLPCTLCVPGPTCLESPPATSQPGPRVQDRGIKKAGRGRLGPLEVKLRGWAGGCDYLLGHLKMGPLRGLNPKATLNKLTKYIQIVNK